MSRSTSTPPAAWPAACTSRCGTPRSRCWTCAARVLAHERIYHAGTEPQHVLPRLARRIPQFLAQHAAGLEPAGLGVAVGGWVDPADGVIVEHALLGWRGVAVRGLLQDATGLPVRLDNHARSLARADVRRNRLEGNGVSRPPIRRNRG